MGDDVEGNKNVEVAAESDEKDEKYRLRSQRGGQSPWKFDFVGVWFVVQRGIFRHLFGYLSLGFLVCRAFLLRLS